MCLHQWIKLHSVLFLIPHSHSLSSKLSLQQFQQCCFCVLAHPAVTPLVCSSTSLPTPSFTPTFFLSLHPSFLPSGSPRWCDAGCGRQTYMRYSSGGGRPRVWALWQRQQVLQLPDVCLSYPQIRPPDTSHFLPKYITESFLLSKPFSVFDFHSLSAPNA